MPATSSLPFLWGTECSSWALSHPCLRVGAPLLNSVDHSLSLLYHFTSFIICTLNNNNKWHINCILLSLYVHCGWALSFCNKCPGLFSWLSTTSLYDCITVFPFSCRWILNCIFLWNRKRQCCYEHSFIWLLVHITKTGCIPWIELLCRTIKHIINS